MRKTTEHLAPSAAMAGGRPSAAGTFRRRLVAIATTLACLGTLALAVDLPVARWCKAHQLPAEIRRLLNFSEAFAHGTGVAVILLVAAVLDPSLLAARRRPLPTAGMAHRNAADDIRPVAATGWSAAGSVLSCDLARAVAAAYAGGLCVDIIKAVVDRVRPRAADLMNATSALATFGEQAAAWARERGVTGAADFNSFPSGHSATAAGLAAALSWRYPRGAWLFAVLAACGAAQRVVSLAHYPSDACLGAALGLGAASFFLGVRPATAEQP